MWPVWHRPQPPVETAEPSPAFFGPALRGRWRKYSSTVLDTYVNLCGLFFFESQSIYTDIYCVYNYIYFVVLDIHDYTWLYMYVWLLVYIHVFLSMILPILKPSKIPRVSKSCQLHWAFGQGTQAEEIGCSAMSVGGICCIVLSINQDMFSHSWLPFEMRRSCEHLLRTLISIPPLLPKQHVALYADFKNYEKNMELPDLFFDTETFLFSLHLRVQSQHWFWMALVGLWSLRLHAARPSCVCTWICRGAKRADGGRVWHSVTPLQSSQCMCELCESEFCRAFWGMAIHESAAFLHMPVGSSRRPQRIYVNQTSCSTALTFANICIPGFTTSVLSRMITAASPCGSSQNSCQTLNSETPLHWKWMNMVCKCLHDLHGASAVASMSSAIHRSLNPRDFTGRC